MKIGPWAVCREATTLTLDKADAPDLRGERADENAREFSKGDEWWAVCREATTLTLDKADAPDSRGALAASNCRRI